MSNRGLTLPEILTTLAIVGILLTCAPPLYAQFGKYRLYSDASQLSHSLRYARTQAILSEKGVTVRAIENSWSNGWNIFIDANGNALRDATEQNLLERRLAGSSVIVGNRPVASHVHFSMTGEPTQADGAFQAGTVTFCTPGLTTRHKIVLGKSGRVRLETTSAGQPCG